MTSKHKIIKILDNLAEDLFPTSSRIICNPAPMNTDEDWMILVNVQNKSKLISHLSNKGYYTGGSMPSSSLNLPTESFTNNLNELDLIITTDKEYFNGFKAATKIGAKLNLKNKIDRIKLFDLVLGQII